MVHTKMIMQSLNKKSMGFTLIELMIVVAIVAFLASIALPSYRNFVVRASRAEAVADLSELASWLERQYTIFGSYDNASMPSLPFSNSPRTGNAKYTITLTSPSSSTYLLTSTPTGGQLADDITCGTLTLSNTSRKCIIGSSGSICSDDASNTQREQVSQCFNAR